MPPAVVLLRMTKRAQRPHIVENVRPTCSSALDVRHVAGRPAYPPWAVAAGPTVPCEALSAKVCQRITLVPDAAQFARYTGTNCHREHPSSNRRVALSLQS